MQEFRSDLPENIICDIEVDPNQIYPKYKLKNQTLMAIGPCIDLECSGVNDEVKKVWKVFNSLFEYRKHLIKINHNMTHGFMAMFKRPNGYSFIKKSIGNIITYYMMEEKDITMLEGDNDAGAIRDRKENYKEGNYLTIIGNNITPACSKVNMELFNRYLF